MVSQIKTINNNKEENLTKVNILQFEDKKNMKRPQKNSIFLT